MGAVVGVVIVLGFMVLPVVAVVHAAMVSDTSFKSIDRSKEVWVAVVLAVPLAWIFYLLFVVPRLRELGPTRAGGQARPLSRSEALALYQRGWRGDEVMAAIRPRPTDRC